jgi:hypothetical protein
MSRNADLRKLLQQRLNVGQAQLYKRAEALANSLSCSTSDAILVLAQKSGINLKKQGGGLSPDKLKEIRELMSHMPAAATALAPVAAGAGSRRGKPKSKKSFKVKVRKGEDDPILSKITHNEMEAMVPVYKTLYTMENSIREFINRVLTAKHGKDWWDKLAPRGLKETVATRMKDESVNAWHQKRSSNAIYYLDLNQLPPLIRQTQADFVDTFFKSVDWFQHFIDEVYQSRCVVCHMNPLVQNNVDGVGIRFNQWETLVKNKIGEVQKLETQTSTVVAEAAPPPVQPTTAAAPPTAPTVSQSSST